jgi:hypothetical protein
VALSFVAARAKSAQEIGKTGSSCATTPVAFVWRDRLTLALRLLFLELFEIFSQAVRPDL